MKTNKKAKKKKKILNKGGKNQDTAQQIPRQREEVHKLTTQLL